MSEREKLDKYVDLKILSVRYRKETNHGYVIKHMRMHLV